MQRSRRTDQRIKLLASDVVDQIAAGEVVERPAHLVKELVENALDAGASSIEVEFDQGGRRVRVTDDGAGIPPSDLALALARHATSKIQQANDLWNLASFGFRGEALASIAAVSRLTLQSRTPDAETAFVVRSEFGVVSDAEPIGGNPGTTILVEDLFANIPARLKFLKSEAGEVAQIRATLRALALANESVEFRLRTKSKFEKVWPRAASFLERAQQVIEAEQLFEANFQYNQYEARVVFASPHEVTGNARGILIFVQDRWVQDRSLQAAVIEAYRGLLMHGEYPIAIVRLRAPPAEVDVNIHPTKSQVKFRESQSPFRAVNRGLREALEKAPWLGNAPPTAGVGHAAGQVQVSGGCAAAALGGSSAISAVASDIGRVSNMSVPPDGGPSLTVYGSDGGSARKKRSVSDLTRSYSNETTEAGTETSNEPFSGGEKAPRPESLETAPVHSVGRFEAPEFNSVLFRQRFDLHGTALDEVGVRPLGPVGGPSGHWETLGAEAGGHWGRLQVLAQANLTYIVAQASDRLVLIDQHAAHERVAYERLMRGWMNGDIEVQPLLLPITVDLEPDGAEALTSVSNELERLGVMIDQIGPQSIAVRSLPLAIKEAALTQALVDLAHEMVERGGGFALERKISDLCASMACHSVVRAGQALSHEQMKRLLSQMDEFPLSSFCPHGRPVSVDYPFIRLERDFGRIV